MNLSFNPVSAISYCVFSCVTLGNLLTHSNPPTLFSHLYMGMRWHPRCLLGWLSGSNEVRYCMEASVNVGGRLLRLLSASVHVALSGHRNGTPDSLMI